MSTPDTIALHMFGAGGAFSRKYGTTCSMIVLPDGKRWLIDCGRQAPDQLAEEGYVWHELAGQIVTHVHGDHVFGLEDFALQRYYESRKNIPGVMAGGERPGFIAHSAVEAEVWECLGPSLRYLKKGDDVRAGTLDAYFEVHRAIASEPPQDNPWRHSESFEAGMLKLVARETMHVPGKPSVTLEISVEPDSDRIAWWSGDSTVDDELLTRLEPRTSIFFHDCTFTDYPGQVHGAFSLLERLPEAVRKKMVLMHHEDDIETHRERAESAGFRVGMPGDTWDLVTGKKLHIG